MTYVTSRRQRPIESYDLLCIVHASKEIRIWSSKRVKKHCTCALINEPTTTKAIETFYTITMCTSIKLIMKFLFLSNKIILRVRSK